MNGVAAIALVESASIPAVTSVDPPTSVEVAIGAAAARAAVAIACAIETARCHGAPSQASKAATAEAVTDLALLQLENRVPDFVAVAGAAGRRELNHRLGAALGAHLHLDGVAIGQVFDFLLGPAIELAAKIVTDELTMQRAWSN